MWPSAMILAQGAPAMERSIARSGTAQPQSGGAGAVRRAQLQEPAAPGREQVGETCQRQGRGTWTSPHSDPHLHFTM
jgi:hypothetical protein